MASTASPFLAFCSDLPGAQRLSQQVPFGDSSALRPGSGVARIQILALQFLQASARLLWNLNRIHWAYLTIFFVSAAVVLWNNYRQATTPILRQQLKWITRGTVLAITP